MTSAPPRKPGTTTHSSSRVSDCWVPRAAVGDDDLDRVPCVVLLFVLQNLVSAISATDAVRRALRDRSVYWLYHPAAALLQTLTYAQG